MKLIPRDIHRIDAILAALEKFWKKPNRTDLRLGQIVANIAKLDKNLDDSYCYEDKDLLAYLEKENE